MTKIKLITENIIDELVASIETASAVYLMVSFVMESGVQLLEEPLKRTLERGDKNLSW